MQQASVPHPAAPLRTVTLLAILALLAAARGGKSQSSSRTASGGGTKPTATTEMAMELPPGAEHMKVAILAPRLAT